MTLDEYEYDGSGVVGNRLEGCGLCGYEFGRNEPRWKHFLEEHGPDDVPSPAGGDRP